MQLHFAFCHSDEGRISSNSNLKVEISPLHSDSVEMPNEISIVANWCNLWIPIKKKSSLPEQGAFQTNQPISYLFTTSLCVSVVLSETICITYVPAAKLFIPSSMFMVSAFISLTSLPVPISYTEILAPTP